MEVKAHKTAKNNDVHHNAGSHFFSYPSKVTIPTGKAAQKRGPHERASRLV